VSYSGWKLNNLLQVWQPLAITSGRQLREEEELFAVTPVPFTQYLGQIVLLLVVFSLSACGYVSRVPTYFSPTLKPSATFSPFDRFRFVATDPQGVLSFMQNLDQDRYFNRTGGMRALAISGGGANGAFGAGMLVGWSQDKDRPVFDMVTGISTGSLIAPFAFAGPSWDETLTAAYHDPQAAKLTRWGGGFFYRPSLYSGKPLAALVARYINADLLKAIASGHRAGRRLLVVTTDLDTQETMVWDMGSIAISAEHPDDNGNALALFRAVLTASASVPGIFPPVVITDGKNTEVHADGGINAPFLLLPESLAAAQISSPRLKPEQLYVIINGQTDITAAPLIGGTMAIVGRSFDSMSRANLRAHLIISTAFAQRHGATFGYAVIPAKVNADPLNFDPAHMEALFQLGLKTRVKTRYLDNFMAPCDCGAAAFMESAKK
jgi:hypothetical protein